MNFAKPLGWRMSCIRKPPPPWSYVFCYSELMPKVDPTRQPHTIPGGHQLTLLQEVIGLETDFSHTYAGGYGNPRCCQYENLPLGDVCRIVYRIIRHNRAPRSRRAVHNSEQRQARARERGTGE